MKKLLALLLALMLPVFALADGNQLTFEVEADSQTFPAWVKMLLTGGSDLSGDAAERYSKAIGALLQDLRICCTTTNEAAEVSIELAGGELLDLVIRVAGDAAHVSSSLIPGYVLAVEKQEATLPSQAEYDWSGLGEGINAALQAWFSGVEPVKTYGVFSGDAYAGGTQCTSWVLDDEDIARLVSSVMNPQMREMISQMLVYLGADAEACLLQLDELNAQVSKENAHHYLVRLVQNDEDEVVGLSFTVTKGASQLATVSIGLQEDSLRLVVGLGLNSSNYWWAYNVQHKQKNHLTLLKGESREWTAPKEAAFSYVQETCVPASAYVWSCNLTQSGARLLWDGSLYSGESAAAEAKCCSFNGALNTDTSAFCTELSLISSTRSLVKIRLAGETGSEITPADPSAAICSLTAEEDKELVGQLTAKLSLELMTRLMQLLPLDVILTLGEMLGQ